MAGQVLTNTAVEENGRKMRRKSRIGDWPGVVRNDTFRWQVLTASLGFGCGFYQLVNMDMPSPLQFLSV